MKKGFTLLETIFVVALSLLLFLAIHSLYTSFSSLYADESAGYAARTSAGSVIRAAESIVLPASRILAAHTFATGTYTTNSATLVVEMLAVDAEGELMTGIYDYAVIYQDASSASLQIEAAAGSARHSRQILLGSSVTDLTFAYDAADVTNAHSVTVSVTVTTTEDHEESTVTLEETIRARNLTL